MAINKGTTACKLPIVFKVPHKKIRAEHREFNITQIINDLAESLKKDDFYVKQRVDKPYILHIYPRWIVNCSFLNIPEESKAFIKQIQSIECKNVTGQAQFKFL